MWFTGFFFAQELKQTQHKNDKDFKIMQNI